MPAASSTASQFFLDVTTATRLPMDLSPRIRATEEPNTCTPRNLRTSLNIAFLLFPRPQTVSLPGGSLGFPPLERDAARTQEAIHAVVARLAVHVPEVVRVYLECLKGFPLTLRYLSQVSVERSLPRGSVHAGCVGDDPVEVEQPGAVLAGVDQLLVSGC